MTATKQASVHVERCNCCGMETYGFAPRPKAPCAQCGRITHTGRWIAKPCQRTIEQAEKDSQGYPYIR